MGKPILNSTIRDGLSTHFGKISTYSLLCSYRQDIQGTLPNGQAATKVDMLFQHPFCTFFLHFVHKDIILEPQQPF